MVNLKFLALAVFAGSLIGGSAAFAQTAPAASADAQASPAADSATPHHRHHGGRMMVALKTLDLSTDQKSKIKDIMTSYRTSRTSATPETREQLRSQVEGVLTPTQVTQFEAKLKPHAAPAASPAP